MESRGSKEREREIEREKGRGEREGKREEAIADGRLADGDEEGEEREIKKIEGCVLSRRR